MAYKYELRSYQAVPGKMGDLLQRFRDHTVEIFPDHGIESIGYWVSKDDDHRLVYLVKHTGDPVQNWESFRSDPRWVQAREESTVNGEITESISSEFMSPTSFSLLG